MKEAQYLIVAQYIACTASYGSFDHGALQAHVLQNMALFDVLQYSATSLIWDNTYSRKTLGLSHLLSSSCRWVLIVSSSST